MHSMNMETKNVITNTSAKELDALCDIRCKQHVLEKFGISIPDENLKDMSIFREFCAKAGLCLSKKYFASLRDIKEALELGSGVIALVDGGEMGGNSLTEMIEDKYVGESPDLAVVVLSLEDDIVICNPALGEEPQRVSREKFIDAWRDSKFYMLAVNTIDKVARSYRPEPVNLEDVSLPEEIEELTETIAENTHEVWSKGRMEEGWSYGPSLDEKARKHPDLLPYSALTEGEKEFDRATAMNAIKMIVKLGFKIEKQ